MTQPCLIFDLDGTLCDTTGVDDECYRAAAAAALNVPPAHIDWTGASHVTDAGIARWLWQRFRTRAPTPEELTRFRLDFVRRLEAERTANLHRFQPVRAAPQLLDDLRRAGALLGIGTGGWRVSAQLKLAAAGLPAELLHATADDAEARVDIFSLAWTRVTASSGRPLATVLFGDSVEDVATARQLGWRFIGVGTGLNQTRLLEAGAGIVVPDYEDRDLHDTLQRAQVPDGAAA